MTPPEILAGWSLCPAEINVETGKLLRAAVDAGLSDVSELFAAWPIATDDAIHFDLAAFNRLPAGAHELVESVAQFVSEKMSDYLGAPAPVVSPPFGALFGNHENKSQLSTP